MIHWLHHLFNPHCPECRDEKICQSCETLTLQLSIANAEKKQLLESILSFSRPAEIVTKEVKLEDIKPKAVTWAVRKQMLESEDRKTAELMTKRKEVAKSINELEKELGIEGESNAG